MKRFPCSPALLLVAVAVVPLTLVSGCPCLFDCGPHESSCTDLWVATHVGHDVACANDTKAPDDAFTRAQERPLQTCGTLTIDGVLAGDDVDVYHAAGTRCATSNPALHKMTHRGRACLFVQCKKGSTALTRCVRGRPRHLDNGLLGCCAESAVEARDEQSVCLVPDAGDDSRGSTALTLSDTDAELDTLCSNGTRDVNAFIIVDGSGESCTDYVVDVDL